MNPLGQYSTKDLVEELKRREGVNAHYAAPHTPYAVDAGDTGSSDEGPATILVVID